MIDNLPTNVAFKEWATVIRALEQGDQILLLRKGGISEEDGKFQIQHHRFLLYPTYEHQYVDLLQPHWHDLFRETAAEAPPINVTRITGYAEIVDLFELKDKAAVWVLRDHYVWNEEYVRTRFNFKPEWPLYGMVLRAYKLPEPIELPFKKEYGGCRSWIELEHEIPIHKVIPALNKEDFSYQVRQLKAPIENAVL